MKVEKKKKKKQKQKILTIHTHAQAIDTHITLCVMKKFILFRRRLSVRSWVAIALRACVLL